MAFSDDPVSALLPSFLVFAAELLSFLGEIDKMKRYLLGLKKIKF